MVSAKMSFKNNQESVLWTACYLYCTCLVGLGHPSCSPALIGNDEPTRPASQPARPHTLNLTFASSYKQKHRVVFGVPLVCREVVKFSTMGKIEWAMWANEQALASGLSEY